MGGGAEGSGRSWRHHCLQRELSLCSTLRPTPPHRPSAPHTSPPLMCNWQSHSQGDTAQRSPCQIIKSPGGQNPVDVWGP